MIQFSSLQEFFAMGGYAFNVWSVYGLFSVFLAVNLLLPLRRKKQLLKDLKRRRIVNEEMARKKQESATIEPGNNSLGEST